MKRSNTSDDQSIVSDSPSTKVRRRCSNRLEEEGRVSKLPDDILVSILSSMITGREEGEIDQVVRTSILSRRWRFLWKYSLKSLNFNFKGNYTSVCDAAYMKFVNRVNHILALPVYSDTIDDFNLTFWSAPPRWYKSDHPHRWIGFALQKRVKRLDIKLGYGFTLDREVIKNHNMNSLVSLCLVFVDVTGDFLEYLLTLCGSLEQLSIKGSTTLVDFTVSGSWLKLKYLKIHDCYELKHLYIRDVNLVSLEYCNDSWEYEPSSTTVIENTPHLINARIVSNGRAILNCLPHLQTLKLFFGSEDLNGPALEFPKLRNLVQLEWDLEQPDFSLTTCASLLVSCPSLCELKLEFVVEKDSYDEDMEAKKLEHPHECLKVVKLVGFIGCKLDTGVALYIIENTLSLETIVVDTRVPFLMGYKESETGAIARASAKEHLGTRLLHTGTNLVVK